MGQASVPAPLYSALTGSLLTGVVIAGGLFSPEPLDCMPEAGEYCCRPVGALEAWTREAAGRHACGCVDSALTRRGTREDGLRSMQEENTRSMRGGEQVAPPWRHRAGAGLGKPVTQGPQGGTALPQGISKKGAPPGLPKFTTTLHKASGGEKEERG